MKFCPQCGTRFSEPGVSFCPNDGSPTQDMQSEPPPDPLIGRVIDGRYRVERAIGEGGMGVVYEITHSILGKRMALKVLRREMASDADVVQRFIQEAQSATSIGHPNIVDISDFGRLPDGSVYFVMEYLDGLSLTRLIRDHGPISPQVALHIVRQMADALEAAHARGIVHRDLKPDNVYLIRQGNDDVFVKILDFGIAKVGGSASKLTRTGMIFGTPHYMSPEQAAGHAVDRRTDAYALGIIMYEIFTGVVPFDGDTFMGILSKHMFEQPPPPSERLQENRPQLGPLEAVIIRLLAKKPDDRYSTMAELIGDLDRISGGHSIAQPSSSGALAAPKTPAPQAGYQSEDYALPSNYGFRVPYSVAGLTLLLAALGSGAGAFFASAPHFSIASAADAISGSDSSSRAGGAATSAGPPSDGTDDSEPGGNSTRESDTPESEAGSGRSGTTSDETATTDSNADESATQAQTDEHAQGSESSDSESIESADSDNAGNAAAEEPVHWVEIVSAPRRAEVLIDGVTIGNTPVRVRADQREEVEVRARGYHSTSFVVGPTSAEQVQIRLERRRRQPSGRQPSGRQPSTETDSTPTPRQPQFGEVLDPWAN